MDQRGTALLGLPALGLVLACVIFGIAYGDMHVAGRPASWLLVVVTDDGHEGGFQIWPGATSWLLGRDEQSFAGEAACATARLQLLRRVDEIVAGTASAPILVKHEDQHDKGPGVPLDVSDVAMAACLPVVDRRRR